MALSGGPRGSAWGLRVALAVTSVAVITAVNVFVEGWFWGRLAIGVLLGAAVATELVLPRAQRGWGDDADSFWHHVATEIERARRHERPLLLVRWPSTDGLDVRPAVRGHDRVCVTGGQVHLLLPEVTAANALPVLRRLGVPVGDGAVEVAEFPRQGLTVDGLLDGLSRFPFEAEPARPTRIAS